MNNKIDIDNDINDICTSTLFQIYQNFKIVARQYVFLLGLLLIITYYQDL